MPNLTIISRALSITLGLGAMFGAAITYKGYKNSIEPSKFELAAQRLGFESTKEQDGLLGILYLAGYLKPDKLWHDIYCFNKGSAKSSIMFSEAMTALKHSQIDQTNKTPNLKLLRKNLFKSADDTVKIEDVEAWILYVAQNAFNRKIGQERNELSSAQWMKDYEIQYLEYAKTLGMVDAIAPKQQEYHDDWIAGASRVGLLARILHHNILIQQVKVNGGVLVLAGQRPLWADLDGINPDTYKKLITAYKNRQDINQLDVSVPVGEDQERKEEGKKYLLDLAKRSDIKLNPEEPFVVYKDGEAPKGLFPDRIYPNYAVGEDRRLTESLMSSDLLETFSVGKAVVIDTQAGEHNQRPNTASTAYDAAKDLVTRIQNGDFGNQKDFTILFISNNPYIKRQTIATQREVDAVVKSYGLDKKGYKVKVEGVGFGAKQDVATIHSEFGALVAEQFKDREGSNKEHYHNIKDLLFQTRKNPEKLPATPEHHENLNYLEWLTGIVQGFFDERI